MSLIKIAWRSIQQRGVASVLTMLSMGLGVLLVVLVLTIYGVISESFRANSSLGYHMIVGARGGGLQLTLNSVYYLSQPVENMPYEYYLAFLAEEERKPQLENSIAYRVQELTAESQQLLQVGQLGIAGGLHDLVAEVAQEQVDRVRLERLGLDKDGMFKNYTQLAIPLALGDSFREYRVVGTTPTLFDDLIYDYERNSKFTFREGRNFQTFTEEHGYFECVIGSQVARSTGLKVGDTINPTHGAPDSPNAHEHEQAFTIVGILDPSGTPNDRAVFVNLEGFFLINDHAKPVDETSGLEDDGSEASEGEEDNEWKELFGPSDDNSDPEDQPGAASTTEEKAAVHSESLRDNETPSPALPRVQPVVYRTGPIGPAVTLQDATESDALAADPRGRWSEFEPLPVEQREITSVLVLFAEDGAGGVLNSRFIGSLIESGVLEGTLRWSEFRPQLAQRSAQAVQPIREIENLLRTFVQPIQMVLLGLTVMICVVSGISILVSIYNSMSERRHEIAVMRSLGASRETILVIVLAESVLISLIGGLLGWVAAHGVSQAISGMIEQQTGVIVGFFSFVPAELYVLPGVLLLAMLVGLYPAISAYRTDVSESLGK